MTLELSQLTSDLAAAGQHIAKQARQRAELLPTVREHFALLNTLTDLDERVALARNGSWNGALPAHEPPTRLYDLPKLPADFTLVAADGSQIAPSIHAPELYYVINVAGFVMRFSSAAAPNVTRRSQLAFRDEHVLLATGDPITDAVISLRRSAEEMHLLADLVEQQPADAPLAALYDGQLALRGRAQEVDEAERAELQERYFEDLNRLAERPTALGGYVDRPNGRVLLRLIYLAPIPLDQVSSHLAMPSASQPYAGLRDRIFLETLLAPGQRTAIFENASGWNREYREYPLKGTPHTHSIHYFYVNVGRRDDPTIARVDLPQWAARTPHLVNYLHAAVVQQCAITIGPAYPYALARADEEAVIQNHERSMVEDMLQVELLRNRHIAETSPKLSHKGTARAGKRRKAQP